jgi:hypothetical protein
LVEQINEITNLSDSLHRKSSSNAEGITQFKPKITKKAVNIINTDELFRKIEILEANFNEKLAVLMKKDTCHGVEPGSNSKSIEVDDSKVKARALNATDQINLDRNSKLHTNIGTFESIELQINRPSNDSNMELHIQKQDSFPFLESNPRNGCSEICRTKKSLIRRSRIIQEENRSSSLDTSLIFENSNDRQESIKVIKT